MPKTIVYTRESRDAEWQTQTIELRRAPAPGEYLLLEGTAGPWLMVDYVAHGGDGTAHATTHGCPHPVKLPANKLARAIQGIKKSRT